MSDLIDEIREDIKEERYAELWKRYGNLAITGAILIILATAVIVWFSAHHQSANEEVAADFYAISYSVNDLSREETLSKLKDISEKQDGTFATLAALKQAAILNQAGKAADAAHIYKEIADNGDASIEFLSLANLLYVSHAIDGDLKAIDTDDINARLETLTSNDGPWKFHAMEQQGLLALRLGEREKAASIFEEIATDFSAPASLRARAEQIAQSIAS